MKYIKPHLSPELRAQITPHTRRDMKLTLAGVFFLVLSVMMTMTIFPHKTQQSQINNKPDSSITQSASQSQSTQEKQVLGVSTQQAPESKPTSTPEPSPAPAQATNAFTQYTVKNGDTLFNISQQYNIKWDLIAQINNLSEPYVLHSGQILKIPQATTSKIPGKIYTIKNGDSLTSIARQFNITVNDIIAVNPNLQKSDLITVGQVIKLP